MYQQSSASSISTCYKTSLCGCHGNMIILTIKQKRSSNTHRNRHVTDDIFTTSSHNLKCKAAWTKAGQNIFFIYNCCCKQSTTHFVIWWQYLHQRNRSDHKGDQPNLQQLEVSLIPHCVWEIPQNIMYFNSESNRTASPSPTLFLLLIKMESSFSY